MMIAPVAIWGRPHRGFALARDLFPGCELMDESDSEGGAARDEAPAHDAAHEAERKAESRADQAADGLRGQIAALRKQVRDAQDTLRDHKRRQETRSFKR